MHFNVCSPALVRYREKYSLGFKQLCKLFIGIFLFPRLPRSDVIHIFQGLRSKTYMDLFENSTVTIIGSYEEQLYARQMGFSFLWAFPIQSSVVTCVYNKCHYFILWQLWMWRASLIRKNKVVLFLYEDTQEVGSFLAEVSTLLPDKCFSVCIQHAYYNCLQPMRYEGKLSQFNFVINEKQAELMKLDPQKTFSIGLNYNAMTQCAGDLSIIFVGTGEIYSLDHYYESLQIFLKIDKLLKKNLRIHAAYRPHPNELAHPDIMATLGRSFSSIDYLSKIFRLSSGRSIYVGNVSSLLFEANQAGHLVANFDLREYWHRSVFSYDHKIDTSDLGEFIRWVGLVNIKASPPSELFCNHLTDPLNRFRLALANANLTV